MDQPTVRVGVDLGGTKIEAIVLTSDGVERARQRIQTPRSYDETIDAIAGLVGAVLSDAGSSSATVGIGIPGAISPATGLVKNANSTWLIGRPLLADLRNRLGVEVRATNDANCFALSEAVDGAGAGANVVFGVILGTGVGGGIVIGGDVLNGANLIAGEWGHNPLPWPTELEQDTAAKCYCGKTGCIETWLSGPAFERQYNETTRHALPARDIVAAAAEGEKAAQHLLVLYFDRLARALATVINIVDPDVVVLGGGMSNIPQLANEVETRLPDRVFSDSVVTRVRPNVHGDSSGVRGAAWLWPTAKA